MDIVKTLRNNKQAQISVIESIILLVMICALYYSTVQSMVELWLTSETYSHGLFILPLTAILLFNRIEQLPRVIEKPSLIPLIFILATSFIWLIATLAHINLLAQLAVTALIPCTVWFRYGWGTTWKLKGPLLFLFLAVPVGDFLIPHLQDVTATLAIAMIELTGIPVYHDGLYISIPAGNFLVAEACSGIRFLISAVTIAIFYSLLYLKSSKNRFLMIALGAVVPIVANGIRVFMIIVIAHVSNMEAATGFDHIVYGWVFFSVVMVLLILLGNLLSDKELVNTVPNTEVASNIDQTTDITTSQSQLATWLYYLLLVVAISLAPATKYVLSYHPSKQAIDPTLIEQTTFNKSLYNQPNVSWSVSFPNADLVLRESETKTQRITRYQIIYLNETNEKELINFNNRLFNPDRWSLKDRRIIPIEIDNKPVMVRHITVVNLKGHKREILMSYLINGQPTARIIKAKALQVISKLMAEDFGGQAIVVSARSDEVNIKQLKLEFANAIQQAQRQVRN